MIPISLYLLWLLVVLFCCGSVVRHLLIKMTGTTSSGAESGPAEEISDTLLLGLVFLTSLVSAVSLMHPIDAKVAIVLSILMVALGGRDLWHLVRTFLSHQGMPTWSLRWVGAGCIGTMVFVAADQAIHYDTGLYHAQMVRWNKEFGVVPGLANLHARLGFDSAWDVFGSFVDHGYFSGRAFHIVSLLIGVILLLTCLRGFQRWLEGSRSVSTIFRCFGFVVILHDYRVLLPSLSNDWAAASLLYYAVILTVEWIEQRVVANTSAVNEANWKAALVAATCVFAVTIKLSTAPIVLLVLLLLSFARNKRQIAALILVPAVCVTVPFLARNVVLTGYLLYPYPTLDLFGFDWKVPRIDAQFQVSLIRYWAIDPAVDWYRAMDMTLGEQLHTWLKHRGNEIVSVIPWFCIGVVTWIGVAIQARMRRRPDFLGNNAICAVLLAGIAFCLIKAPDPRFAMGWFLAFGLFPAAWFCHGAADFFNASRRIWSLIGCLILAGSVFWMGRNAGVKRLLSAPKETVCRLNDLPVTEMKEARSEHGVLVTIPVNDNRAWNAALPNTPEFNRWLQLRGPRLKDGFRVTKPAFQEWQDEARKAGG
ncbi:MAG: hypothetical protein QOH39_2147 [Verrucomicrobiota bacterium]